MGKRAKAPPPASIPEQAVVVNDWNIFAHPLFLQQFEELLGEVERFKAQDPKGYREKKKTKLLAAITKMGFEVIPANPADPAFRQGNTLGPTYRHWQRGELFEGHYRLFFRYSSAAKVIVLAWVNDEETLRTYGSKTDAYAVFKGMLDKDRPPDDWDALLREAHAATSRAHGVMKRGKNAQ